VNISPERLAEIEALCRLGIERNQIIDEVEPRELLTLVAAAKANTALLDELEKA